MQPPRHFHTSQLTRKGQVTIPAEVRRHLGLKQGDKVAFVQEGDTVTVWPAASVTERTAGALRQYRRTPASTPEQERAAFAQAVADEPWRQQLRSRYRGVRAGPSPPAASLGRVLGRGASTSAWRRARRQPTNAGHSGHNDRGPC